MQDGVSKSAHELVPEAYFLPEMYTNINSIVFPISPLTKRNISCVVLPPWAKSPRHFVSKMKSVLESDIVSNGLHEFIDLIWGIRQNGPLAFERFNIFQTTAYEHSSEEMSVLEELRTFGEAPRQLFVSPHPRRKFTNSNRSIILTLNCDRRSEPVDSGWTLLTNQTKVRMTNNGFELFLSPDRPTTQFVMSDEIKPICIAASGNTFATGHHLPVVHYWKTTQKDVRHLAVLRGNLGLITAITCQSRCALILSGHQNGVVSVFVTSPRRQFVRQIESFAIAPIIAIQYMRAKSQIIAVQIVFGQTIITIWTVNGDFVKSEAFDFITNDLIVTSFELGVRKNVIVILTNGGWLAVLGASSLKKKQKIEVDREMVRGRLSIWRDRFVCLRAGRRLMTWSIEFVAEDRNLTRF
jgi:hypothetical protein